MKKKKCGACGKTRNLKSTWNKWAKYDDNGNPCNGAWQTKCDECRNADDEHEKALKERGITMDEYMEELEKEYGHLSIEEIEGGSQ